MYQISIILVSFTDITILYKYTKIILNLHLFHTYKILIIYLNTRIFSIYFQHIFFLLGRIEVFFENPKNLLY